LAFPPPGAVNSSAAGKGRSKFEPWRLSPHRQGALLTTPYS
jgi:hypothetical protein